MSEDYSKYINQVVTTEKNSKYTITNVRIV